MNYSYLKDTFLFNGTFRLSFSSWTHHHNCCKLKRKMDKSHRTTVFVLFIGGLDFCSEKQKHKNSFPLLISYRSTLTARLSSVIRDLVLRKTNFIRIEDNLSLERSKRSPIS